MSDLMFGTLSIDAFTPRGMMKMSLDVMQQSAGAFGAVMPGRESRVVWVELQNKTQTFNLFANADSVLGLGRGGRAPLSELVARARSLGAYRSVWATEGLGYYRAEMSWERSGAPSNLLGDERAGALPSSGLAALHSGMGLSLAARVFRALGTQSPGPEVRAALRRFAALCRDNSRPAYVGAAYEASGLIARSLHPQLVRVLGRRLREVDEELPDFFWHGVGRALYFAPTNFLPFNSAPWRAVGMSRSEPEDEAGRLNAQAGLVWALALVNLRHPEILEALLKHHRDELSRGALADGVASACAVWLDSTGDESHLEALCRHRPASPEPGLAALWESHVSRPCRDACSRLHPHVKERDRLGELFRYQPPRTTSR